MVTVIGFEYEDSRVLVKLNSGETLKVCHYPFDRDERRKIKSFFTTNFEFKTSKDACIAIDKYRGIKR